MARTTRRRRATVLVVATVGVLLSSLASAGPLGAEPPQDVPEPSGVNLGTATNAGNATFSFTSDIPGAESFDITTEHQVGFVSFDAAPGTYTVTQLPPPPPYAFGGAFGEGCTQVGPTSYEVVVTEGDVTTCFTFNEQTILQVVTVAIGQDGTFTYTTDIPGLPTFEVTTDGGQGSFEAPIPSGTWTITQQGPPAPFTFEDVDRCPPGPSPGTATVTVGDGDRAVCTFTNRAPGTTIQGPDVTGPFPATTSVPVSSLPPAGSPVGMGSPLPAADVPPGAPESLGTFGGLSTENGAFSSPLDPNGDVGPDHYVQTVNTMFAVFAKDGTLLAGPFDNNQLWTGAGGQCEANNDGDPVVLYDQTADRWLFGQFYLGEAQSGPYGMCLAVSQTGDPTGAYHLYEVAAPWFNDYPKLGVWDDAFYMTTQPGGFNKADLYALDRDAMLAGEPVRSIRFTVNPTTFLLPPDLDGSTPPPPDTPAWFTAFEGPSTTAGGPHRLTVFAFDADFDNPGSSTLELAADVPISPFRPVCGDERGGRCVPVPDTGQEVDALDDIPMYRAAYRNYGDQQTIVGNFSHGVGTAEAPVAATRWWELRDVDGTWRLHQEGDLAGGTLSRWAGSAAQDRNGALALGYSVSDLTTFPSIRYAARSPLDASGTLGPEATMVEGGGSESEGNRWGDYTALTVDPVDDCTFWYTNTYYEATGVEVSSAIGSFRRPDCAPVDLSVSLAASPASVAPGGTVEHTIEYGNAAGTAAEVALTATVPTGTTFAGGTGWSGCDVGAAAGSVCTLDVGGLTPGERGTATFSVRVADGAGAGTVRSEVGLSAGYGGGEVRADATTEIALPPAPAPAHATDQGPPAAMAVVVRPRLTG